MPSHTSSRVTEVFKICAIIATTALLLSVAVPVTAEATNHLITLVGPSGDKAKVSDTGALKVGDGEGPMTVNGTVDLAGRPPVRPAEVPFSRYVRVVTTTSGTQLCETLPLPAGKVLLKSVAVTVTGEATTPTTYLLLSVKSDPAFGHLMQQRISNTSSAPDPVNPTRSGVLNFDLVAAGNTIGDAKIGDVFAIEACIEKTSGQAPAASFLFTGIVLP